MNDYASKILDFIQENRVNTTEVSDALGKTGLIPSVLPINEGQFRVGKVRCVFTANMSNYDVHEQIKHVEKDDVVIVFTHNCEGRSIIGELMAKYTLLYRRASAMIIQGTIRDVAAVKREKFSIWSTGVSPIGCFNIIADPFPAEKRQEILDQYEGGIAVCDDGGVVVIPKSLHNADMLEKLERIEMQEDVWFFCLDALKWDTKKIVCDKAYLNELEHLPEIFKSKAASLSKPLDKK
jgi:4-hydroxy-4-methyl-2-oxoglutarate aldolase